VDPARPYSGGAICCKDEETCTKKIRDLCAGLPMAVMEGILSGGDPTKIENAVKQAIEAIIGYIMPQCVV